MKEARQCEGISRLLKIRIGLVIFILFILTVGVSLAVGSSVAERVLCFFGFGLFSAFLGEVIVHEIVMREKERIILHYERPVKKRSWWKVFCFVLVIILSAMFYNILIFFYIPEIIEEAKALDQGKWL